jgi:hypothetical protein
MLITYPISIRFCGKLIHKIHAMVNNIDWMREMVLTKSNIVRNFARPLPDGT